MKMSLTLPVHPREHNSRRGAAWPGSNAMLKDMSGCRLSCTPGGHGLLSGQKCAEANVPVMKE